MYIVLSEYYMVIFSFLNKNFEKKLKLTPILFKKVAHYEPHICKYIKLKLELLHRKLGTINLYH